jgi:hypothetical protein
MNGGRLTRGLQQGKGLVPTAGLVELILTSQKRHHCLFIPDE